MTETWVFDASAVLAWLQDEPGADSVESLISGAHLSAANWSEILQKVIQKGRDEQETAVLLKSMGLRIEPVLEEDAEVSARLWSFAPMLSLGDRFCLALALRLSASALTADGAWAGVDCGVRIIAIR